MYTGLNRADLGPAIRACIFPSELTIFTRQGWTTASGSLRVRVKQPFRTHLTGEQIELLGWLSRYRTPQNPGPEDLVLLAQDKFFDNLAGQIECTHYSGCLAVVLTRNPFDDLFHQSPNLFLPQLIAPQSS